MIQEIIMEYDETNESTNTKELCFEACENNLECIAFHFGKNERQGDCILSKNLYCTEDENFDYYRMNENCASNLLLYVYFQNNVFCFCFFQINSKCLYYWKGLFYFGGAKISPFFASNFK